LKIQVFGVLSGSQFQLTSESEWTKNMHRFIAAGENTQAIFDIGIKRAFLINNG
jgi:hypothetical protein